MISDGEKLEKQSEIMKMSDKTDTLKPSEGMDRSVYSKFIAWARGDKAQTVAALLLILGSLIYQVWQDPGQLEFVKIIAILFIATAIVEEFFELKGKNVDLEKDKISLEKDKTSLLHTVAKVEKAQQAEFLMNKNIFHGDVIGILLDKLGDYLSGDNYEKGVVNHYREMIDAVQEKAKKYAGYITNSYKDFLTKVLQEREEANVPITEFKKVMIMDNLTNKTESEYKDNLTENKEAITDFNKDHTNEE